MINNNNTQSRENVMFKLYIIVVWKVTSQLCFPSSFKLLWGVVFLTDTRLWRRGLGFQVSIKGANFVFSFFFFFSSFAVLMFFSSRSLFGLLVV